VVVEVVGTLDLAGEKPASERAVGDDPDPELTSNGHDAVFEVARPQRPLALQSGDGMDGVGSPNRLRSRLGQTQEADLPGLHELSHGADGLLDGNRRVDPMLVVEVDMVEAKALE